MGEAIKSLNIFPDLMISSPATRALATARLMAEHLNYPLNKIVVSEDIYEAWLDDLLNVIKSISTNHISVMLIGHNPGLQLLAEYITEFPYDNIPTCGVVGLDLIVDNWKDLHKDCGRILFFEAPKKDSRIA
jgi:phosphohistidine phosphatase